MSPLGLVRRRRAALCCNLSDEKRSANSPFAMRKLNTEQAGRATVASMRWPFTVLRRKHDRLLLQSEEPPVAAHLVSPRRMYTHHGIYVGRGRVIHYSGFSSGLRRGPVEEVSLEEFACGSIVRVRSEVSAFDRSEVVRRARARLGESQYRLLSNNCIHFCRWCWHGAAAGAERMT
jgi:Lecithin retinol acyltransferase